MKKTIVLTAILSWIIYSATLSLAAELPDIMPQSLTAEQQQKLAHMEKSKSGTLDAINQQQDQLMDRLLNLLEARGTNSDFSLLLDNIKSNLKTIKKTEMEYWNGLAGAFGAMPTAAILLQSLPLENTEFKTSLNGFAQIPRGWLEYLALTQDLKSRMEELNTSTAGKINQYSANWNEAARFLQQQLASQANTTTVQLLVGNLTYCLQTIGNTEIMYWNSVEGLLSPVQVAKLYLLQKQKLVCQN